MTLRPVDILTRRFFLQDMALGLGGIALGSLMQAGAFGKESASKSTAQNSRAVLSHFAPRAKHVIFLFMAGGPSQLDLFDPKPALVKYEGQQVPDEVLKGAELAVHRARCCSHGVSVQIRTPWPIGRDPFGTAASSGRSCGRRGAWCDRYTRTHSIMLRHNFY